MKQSKYTVPENFFIQSGVLPFRKVDGEFEILLITSRKKKRWIFPKGVVEDNLGKKGSAIKEAFEEAGAIGKIIGNSIGELTNNKWGGKCNVRIYPMEVSKTIRHWDEESFRKRKWFTINEALDALTDKSSQKILRQYFKKQAQLIR